jgi:hypothetical protein
VKVASGRKLRIHTALSLQFRGNCIIKSFVARANPVIFVRKALVFNCDPSLDFNDLPFPFLIRWL